MTYKEKLSAKLNILAKHYNSYFENIDLNSKEFEKMKKKEVLNLAIEHFSHSKSMLNSVLPLHEKNLDKILSKCEKDTEYCRIQQEKLNRNCGDLWAIKKTIKEKKEAIGMYNRAIKIVKAEIRK